MGAHKHEVDVSWRLGFIAEKLEWMAGSITDIDPAASLILEDISDELLKEQDIVCGLLKNIEKMPQAED